MSISTSLGLRRALSIAALATLTSSSITVGAQDAAALNNAKMLFNAGTQAYANANYIDAIKLFRAALAVVPRATILFSLAQAERKQYFAGDHDEALLKSAVMHFRQYLGEVKEGGRRADATTALAELEVHLPPSGSAAPAPAPAPPAMQETQLAISTNADEATAWLDGQPSTMWPLVKTVAPGKHHVKVSAPGYFDDERDVPAVPGVTFPVNVELREKPALVQFRATDGADVSIDGKFVGTTPFARPVELAPGGHVFAVTKNGYKAFTYSARIERNTTLSIPVVFERTGQRTTSFVLLGSGGVSIVAGGVFTALAFGQQSRAQRILDAKARGNIDGPDLGTYNDAVDQRDRWKNVATITFGAGAVLAAMGTALFFLDKPSVALPAPPPEAPPKPAPAKQEMEMGAAPIFGPGMYGAGVFGRF